MMDDAEKLSTIADALLETASIMTNMHSIMHIQYMRYKDEDVKKYLDENDKQLDVLIELVGSLTTNGK